MTWVIAAGTFLGYGVIISDTCVTYGSIHGTKETRDCLQKNYYVGPSIIAGFAGSVKIGFELLDDLARFLHIFLEEQGNGSWIPQWAAENWKDRAKFIFDSKPDFPKQNSGILMVCAHPTEDHGSPRDPKIYVIKMRSPDFEPMVISDYSTIFSIGSGSDVAIYKQTLQDLLEEDGYSPLMQLDVGGLLPGQPLRPASQKDLVGESHPLLTIVPGQRLHLDAATRAIDPARRIAEVSLERPDRQILEQALGLPIVHAAPFAALGTNRPSVAAGLNVNDQGFHTIN